MLMAPLTAWGCPGHEIPDTEAIKDEALGSSGLHIYYYDTDGDGQADRALVYGQAARGDPADSPLFFFEGLDPVTGVAEEVWIDRNDNGWCSDIVLYYKRHVRL